MDLLSFSLTEKCILNPVLTLRTPPPETENARELTTKVRQIAESEVIARVIVIFASLFATVDSLAHLSMGAYKSICLHTREICSYNPSEISTHFQQAKLFAKLATIGTVQGVIKPESLEQYRFSHQPQSLSGPMVDFVSPHSPIVQLADAPASVQQLAEDVQKGKETAPFDRLKAFWKSASLQDKHWFVQVFNQDGESKFKTIRTNLADLVYKRIQPLKDRQVNWLSSNEIDQRLIRSWKRANLHNHSFYYHATSEKALESILKSKKVEVRHEKLFKGAFVSTKPETGFGRCILAFKSNIERLSKLEHGFQAGENTYWAGFSHEIPVTDSTLAYVILDKGNQQECQELEQRCQQWTDRPIKVISLEDAKTHLQSIEQLDMGIPSEWKSDNEKTGTMILNTLRASAAVQAPTVRLRQPVAMAH